MLSARSRPKENSNSRAPEARAERFFDVFLLLEAALDRTRPQTNLPLDGKTHCFRASLLSDVNRPILACEVHAYLMHMHLHESDLSEDTSEARS